MTVIYLYMQMPDSLEVATIGRLSVENNVGEFVYSPAHVKAGGWVPDASRYPLRSLPYTRITKNRGIPGFIRDAAPDGWGERLVAREHGDQRDAIGFILKSPNHDRTGNLMAGAGRQPPTGIGQAGLGKITQLEAFIQFADGVQGGFPRDADKATKATLQQRSSLGGARPKCTLINEDQLMLAKPRDRHDAFDVPALEYACMTFAASKGMNVAKVQLHRGRVNTLLVERFDRVPAGAGQFYRIPMLSGLTLLDSDWNNPLSWAQEWHYGLLADEMSRRGVPQHDRQELFKRICFNILVGNDDDHPKNVAVLYLNGTWRLSPMYDVLPTTEMAAPSSLAMGVGSFGKELSRRNLLSQVGHYGLSPAQAAAIIDEVVGWEAALKAHYRQHLQPAELELALLAMGADKLRT
ncbi:type II toxin-antitoxin system HipA family toxin [Pseudomonas sichuanensis]|uniref:type II toxin-antitoxin system HipA family toxin n=1 Tax=Pseudomonas sichuanensis TaxID=2213015 RepID=UPI00244B9A5B|nr:type II toxin-antitoxin system HipA family toxin [Pseudomonas sichuanensis]MDH0732927.1 type II toxin-antitoxin system HipA family toxin [Pseudomonas sichuanensis]MDH1581943.1 type II toxin-antitoxin system HipA family toxin [Pseudomonas sichuanensis]MDH1591379.1 type II toxin-antitoxin system HipA family toxin [Pseudomonas sichuanensis]MDH1597019.1 type II toxin-antitoxin system HipA family toxin [Pseudomonas sichuanensis]